MPKLTVTPNRLNPYESVRDLYGQTELYNALGGNTGWSYAARASTPDANYVEMFAGLLAEKDKIGDVKAFQDEYNTKYLNSFDKLTAGALAAGWFDNETLNTRTRTKTDENGNPIVNDKGEYETEEYQTTDYDYYKSVLKERSDYNQELDNQRLAALAKKDRKGFVKFLATISDIPIQFIAEVESTVHNVWNFLSASILALTSLGNPDKTMDEAFREQMSKQTFGDMLLTATDEWRCDWTWEKTANGQTTGYGSTLSGVVGTITAMLPTMGLQAGISALGKAGKISSSVAKGLSAAASAEYWVRLGFNNVADYCKDDTYATVSTWALIANGLITAGIQAAISFGFEALFTKLTGSSTMIHSMLYGQSYTATAAGQVTSMTTKNAIVNVLQRILHDSVEQGVEEILQEWAASGIDELTSMVTNGAFSYNSFTIQQALNAFWLAALTTVLTTGSGVLTTKRVENPNGEIKGTKTVTKTTATVTTKGENIKLNDTSTWANDTTTVTTKETEVPVRKKFNKLISWDLKQIRANFDELYAIVADTTKPYKKRVQATQELVRAAKVYGAYYQMLGTDEFAAVTEFFDAMNEREDNLTRVAAQIMTSEKLAKAKEVITKQREEEAKQNGTTAEEITVENLTDIELMFAYAEEILFNAIEKCTQEYSKEYQAALKKSLLAKVSDPKIAKAIEGADHVTVVLLDTKDHITKTISQVKEAVVETQTKSKSKKEKREKNKNTKKKTKVADFAQQKSPGEQAAEQRDAEKRAEHVAENLEKFKNEVPDATVVLVSNSSNEGVAIVNGVVVVTEETLSKGYEEAVQAYHEEELIQRFASTLSVSAALQPLRKLYKSLYNEDADNEMLVANLLFNRTFLALSLQYATADVIKFLTNVCGWARQRATELKTKDTMKVGEKVAYNLYHNLQQVIGAWYVDEPGDVDTRDIEAGLSRIFSETDMKKLEKRRDTKDNGIAWLREHDPNREIKNNDEEEKQRQERLIAMQEYFDRTINALNLSDEEKETLKKNLFSKNKTVRNKAIDTYIGYYKERYYAYYDGKTYFERTSVQKHIANQWLQTNDMTIGDLLNPTREVLSKFIDTSKEGATEFLDHCEQDLDFARDQMRQIFEAATNNAQTLRYTTTTDAESGETYTSVDVLSKSMTLKSNTKEFNDQLKSQREGTVSDNDVYVTSQSSVTDQREFLAPYVISDGDDMSIEWRSREARLNSYIRQQQERIDEEQKDLDAHPDDGPLTAAAVTTTVRYNPKSLRQRVYPISDVVNSIGISDWDARLVNNKGTYHWELNSNEHSKIQSSKTITSTTFTTISDARVALYHARNAALREAIRCRQALIESYQQEITETQSALEGLSSEPDFETRAANRYSATVNDIIITGDYLLNDSTREAVKTDMLANSDEYNASRTLSARLTADSKTYKEAFDAASTALEHAQEQAAKIGNQYTSVEEEREGLLDASTAISGLWDIRYDQYMRRQQVPTWEDVQEIAEQASEKNEDGKCHLSDLLTTPIKQKNGYYKYSKALPNDVRSTIGDCPVTITTVNNREGGQLENDEDLVRNAHRDLQHDFHTDVLGPLDSTEDRVVYYNHDDPTDSAHYNTRVIKGPAYPVKCSNGGVYYRQVKYTFDPETGVYTYDFGKYLVKGNVNFSSERVENHTPYGEMIIPNPNLTHQHITAKLTPVTNEVTTKQVAQQTYAGQRNINKTTTSYTLEITVDGSTEYKQHDLQNAIQQAITDLAVRDEEKLFQLSKLQTQTQARITTLIAKIKEANTNYTQAQEALQAEIEKQNRMKEEASNITITPEGVYHFLKHEAERTSNGMRTIMVNQEGEFCLVDTSKMSTLLNFDATTGPFENVHGQYCLKMPSKGTHNTYKSSRRIKDYIPDKLAAKLNKRTTSTKVEIELLQGDHATDQLDAYYNYQTNTIKITQGIGVQRRISASVLMHEIEHVLMTNAGLNIGVSQSVFKDFRTPVDLQATIVEDVIAHVPDILTTKPEWMSTTQAVELFLSNRSGELNSLGLSADRVNYDLPVIATYTNEGLHLVMPWGAEYTLTRTQGEYEVYYRDDIERIKADLNTNGLTPDTFPAFQRHGVLMDGYGRIISRGGIVDFRTGKILAFKDDTQYKTILANQGHTLASDTIFRPVDAYYHAATFTSDNNVFLVDTKNIHSVNISDTEDSNWISIDCITAVDTATGVVYENMADAFEIGEVISFDLNGKKTYTGVPALLNPQTHQAETGQIEKRTWHNTEAKVGESDYVVVDTPVMGRLTDFEFKLNNTSEPDSTANAIANQHLGRSSYISQLDENTADPRAKQAYEDIENEEQPESPAERAHSLIANDTTTEFGEEDDDVYVLNERMSILKAGILNGQLSMDDVRTAVRNYMITQSTDPLCENVEWYGETPEQIDVRISILSDTDLRQMAANSIEYFANVEGIPIEDNKIAAEVDTLKRRYTLHATGVIDRIETVLYRVHGLNAITSPEQKMWIADEFSEYLEYDGTDLKLTNNILLSTDIDYLNEARVYLTDLTKDLNAHKPVAGTAAELAKFKKSENEAMQAAAKANQEAKEARQAANKANARQYAADNLVSTDLNHATHYGDVTVHSTAEMPEALNEMLKIAFSDENLVFSNTHVGKEGYLLREQSDKILGVSYSQFREVTHEWYDNLTDAEIEEILNFVSNPNIGVAVTGENNGDYRYQAYCFFVLLEACKEYRAGLRDIPTETEKAAETWLANYASAGAGVVSNARQLRQLNPEDYRVRQELGHIFGDDVVDPNLTDALSVVLTAEVNERVAHSTHVADAQSKALDENRSTGLIRARAVDKNGKVIGFVSIPEEYAYYDSENRNSMWFHVVNKIAAARTRAKIDFGDITVTYYNPDGTTEVGPLNEEFAKVRFITAEIYKDKANQDIGMDRDGYYRREPMTDENGNVVKNKDGTTRMIKVRLEGDLNGIHTWTRDFSIDSANKAKLASKILEIIYEDVKEKTITKGTKFDRFLTKFVEFERTCMLSWPGTWVRNYLSNAIIMGSYRPIQTMGKAVTGLFTKAGPGKTSKERGEAFVETWNENPKNEPIVTYKDVKVTRGEVKEARDFLDAKVFDGKSVWDLTRDGIIKTTNKDEFIPRETVEIQNKEGEHYRTKREKTTEKYVGNKVSPQAINTMVEMMIRQIASRVYKDTRFNNKVAKGIVNALYKCMSDDPFIKNRAEYYLAGFVKQEGLTLDVNDMRIWRFYQLAMTQASIDYMHNKNFLGHMMNELKGRSTFGWTVVMQLYPFLGSIWNWWTEAMKYTPVGLAHAIYQMLTYEKQLEKDAAKSAKGEGSGMAFTWHNIQMNMGKGIVGTIMTVIGATLTALGIAQLDEEDDKMKIKLWGNTYLDISGVFGTSSLVAGMSFMDLLLHSDDATVDRIVAALDSIATSLLDDSIFSSLFSSFRYSQSVGEWFMDSIMNLPSMLIPNIIKQTNKLINQTDKIQYANGIKGDLQYLLVQLIPGIGYAMPRYIDIYTGEVKSTYIANTFMQIFNAISPIDIEPYSYSEIELEAMRLGLTHDLLSGKYEDIGTLTNKQKAALNEMYGKLNSQELNKLIHNKISYTVTDENGKSVTLRYNQMTDEQKKSAFNGIMSKNASYAKIYTFTSVMGGKYYASDSMYEILKSLGIRTRVYKENGRYSGFRVTS